MAIDKQADRKVGRQRKPHSVIGFGGVREGSIQRAEHGEINVVINVYTHTPANDQCTAQESDCVT